VLLLLCFILYLRAISKCKPPGAYVLRGQVMEGLLCYEFERLILGGAYFSEFYGMQICVVLVALVVEVA